MTADVLAQFLEATACFTVGAYFGVKFAFTEIISACSGKILRCVLQFIYGLSYALSLGLVVFAAADADFHYYHFLLQIIGAICFIPLSRKIFSRYKKPIQKFWLRLIGSVELLEKHRQTETTDGKTITETDKAKKDNQNAAVKIKPITTELTEVKAEKLKLKAKSIALKTKKNENPENESNRPLT